MRTALFSLLIGLLVLSAPALATGSISITSVSIPTSATQGASFTVTMSVSGSSVTDVSGSLTLPSGISCTPSGSQTISLNAYGTGSASWSCSASVAGDYSNQITASVSAKDSGTGATVSDSSQTGLTVLSPASLTSSSTLSSSSVAAGSSVTFTVGINNVGDSATTYNISLTCPTGLTCSPSSVGNTAISGQSLSNNQFTITGGTAGSYTLTATISSTGQSDMTTSGSLTVTAGGNVTGGGGAGAGAPPGTRVSVERGKATITVPSIAASGMATISITKTEDIAVRTITIAVSNAVRNIQIVIQKLVGRPSDVAVDVSGTAYHYIKIDKTNFTDADITNATINFAVADSWVTSNAVDTANVRLNRWSGSAWNELATSYTGKVGDEHLYSATSPGLSYFAITAQVTGVTPPAAGCPTCLPATAWSDCVNGTQTRTNYRCSAGTNYTCEAYSESQTCEIEAAIPPLSGILAAPGTTWVIAIVIIVAIAAGAYYYMSRKGRPYHFRPYRHRS